MDEQVEVFLECEIDRNPQAPAFFVVGYATSRQEFENQPQWPTGKWPLTVLCNACFRPSKYSLQHIRTRELDTKAQHQHPPKRIWCIEVQCVQESCGTLTKIYFQAGIGSTKSTIQLEISGRQVRIPCQTCRQDIELTFQSCENAGVVVEVRA